MFLVENITKSKNKNKWMELSDCHFSFSVNWRCSRPCQHYL